MSTLPTGSLRPFQPQRFGRFTLLAPLAAGGMGQIYLARARFAGGLEKICVIKKVLPELARDAGFASRFREEATTLIQLQHGSIAQVYDSGEEAGEWWIALEFVDGKDLRRLLQRLRGRGKRMPLDVALYVAVKLLEALAYAHRKKDESGADLALVHRDVSPQNVLLSYEGEVKVIDFGLARSTKSAPERDPSVVMGKFHYMAPEQARNLPLDRRADLYAVGVILYEAITGWNPFEEASSVEVVEWAATPRIPPVQRLAPAVPDSLAQTLGKALAIDPDERFASAEEMRAQLGACLSELAPEAGPEQLAALVVREFADEHERERAWMASLNRGESAPPSPAAEETTRAASVPLRTPTGGDPQRGLTARFGAARPLTTQRFDTTGRGRPAVSPREEAAAAALAGVTTEPRAPRGAAVGEVLPWDRDRSGGAAALRSAAAAASSVPRSLPWYESASSQRGVAEAPAPERTPQVPMHVRPGAELSQDDDIAGEIAAAEARPVDGSAADAPESGRTSAERAGRRWPLPLAFAATALILAMWWQRTPVPPPPPVTPIVAEPIVAEPEEPAPVAEPPAPTPVEAAPAEEAPPEPAPAVRPFAAPAPEPRQAPQPPAPAPIAPVAPARTATAAPRRDPRAALLAQRRRVMRNYEELVGAHGADQVGGILAGLVRATDSQFQRLIDDPENYDDLQRQLDELDRLLEERRRAFAD